MQFPKGVRKYIREQKAQIRRENPDAKKREELIQVLYQRLTALYTKQPIASQKQ